MCSNLRSHLCFSLTLSFLPLTLPYATFSVRENLMLLIFGVVGVVEFQLEDTLLITVPQFVLLFIAHYSFFSLCSVSFASPELFLFDQPWAIFQAVSLAPPLVSQLAWPCSIISTSPSLSSNAALQLYFRR